MNEFQFCRLKISWRITLSSFVCFNSHSIIQSDRIVVRGERKQNSIQMFSVQKTRQIVVCVCALRNEFELIFNSFMNRLCVFSSQHQNFFPSLVCAFSLFPIFPIQFHRKVFFMNIYRWYT